MKNYYTTIYLQKTFHRRLLTMVLITVRNVSNVKVFETFKKVDTEKDVVHVSGGS